MTPKEKAIELINRFSIVGLQQRDEGIECALICVDVILSSMEDEMDNYYYNKPKVIYWQDVKEEINKL